MSIEEAITHCLEVADGQTAQGKCPECAADHRQLAEWLTDYKRLREQQPCGDCISRQAVLDLIEHYNSDGLGSAFYGYEQGVKFADRVNKLPPVNPQEPRTGHWRHYEGMLICSACRAEFYDDIMEYCGDDVPKCCPDCGARMQEVQE